MEAPTTFLGIHLIQEDELLWTANPGKLSVRIVQRRNVKYTDGSVDPVVWEASVSLRNGFFLYTEEHESVSFEELEAYFEKWIKDGQEVAREFLDKWPMMAKWNLNTQTGRLRSDRPNLSNSPKADK